MDAPSVDRSRAGAPTPAAILELLKPITWFPPMWAYACGAISAGPMLEDRWLHALGGVILVGPLVCGGSQAVNDWFDRHVDAINEPDRVIPSGRMPGAWGFWIAIAMSALALVFAALLGSWVLGATVLGVALAWAYSAPPARLKANGWWGAGVVGFSYESLPWLTAAAVALGGVPSVEIVIIALLYGLGAHGILTLNDFKAVEGDARTGVGSLPVRLGVDHAARIACAMMAGAQIMVIALLAWWGAPWFAAAVAVLLLAQGACMPRLLRDPRAAAVWYSAVGVGLYVFGMMVAALALRGMPAVSAAG